MSLSTSKRIFNEGVSVSKEIYVLSDIHLGTNEKTDWYQKNDHEEQLVGLLQEIQKQAQESDNEVDLVLAGDIFDTWLCEMNAIPPTIESILKNNQKVIDEFKICLEHCKVFYLNGNHDMTVTADDLKGIHVTGDKKNKLQWVNAYRTGLLKIEHGHRFAMFNARDRLHDPLHGFPVGYYITRMLAGDDTYDKPGAIASYVDNMLQAAITTKTISSAVIEALMEHRRMEPSDVFTMPFGRRDMTIAEVMGKYKKLFELWVDKFGYVYAINSVRAELGSLNWFADRMSSRGDYKVIVMGHSHECLVDRDSLLQSTDTIYANSGFWATKQPSYIHILKDKGSYEVSLFEKTKKTKTKKSKFIRKEKEKIKLF